MPTFTLMTGGYTQGESGYTSQYRFQLNEDASRFTGESVISNIDDQGSFCVLNNYSTIDEEYRVLLTKIF